MKIFNKVASIYVFFALSALLLFAFLIGGVIPQGLQPGEYAEMFGRVGSAWVLKGGLGRVFSSWWFLALIAAAAVNLLACTLKQWRIVRQRPGLFLSHLGVLLMFAGGFVGGLFSQRGSLGLVKGHPLSSFTDQRGLEVKLPFEVELKDFRITYWEKEQHLVHAVRDGHSPQGHAEGDGHDHGPELLETVVVKEGETVHFSSEAQDLEIVKYYPDFSIGDAGPVSLSESPRNPALAVRLAGAKARKDTRPAYLFANHPDFHGVPESNGVRYVYEVRPGRVKQYESRISIIEGGAEAAQKLLSVNSPASYKGYRLYQSGFDEQNPDFSSLQIVRDPSVWLIYAGFGVVMLGFTWAFRREF